MLARNSTRGMGGCTTAHAIVEKSPSYADYRRIALWGCFALLTLTGLIYLGDDLYARSRGRPVEHLQVGRVYAAVNRYNQVEFDWHAGHHDLCRSALATFRLHAVLVSAAAQDSTDRSVNGKHLLRPELNRTDARGDRSIHSRAKLSPAAQLRS